MKKIQLSLVSLKKELLVVAGIAIIFILDSLRSYLVLDKS